MSTKTIKQRIALVAVSALTAGLFTVVSAPVANAAQAAANSAYATASQLLIGTTADTDGTPDVPNAAQLSTLVVANRVSLSSVGWVADTNATSGGSSSVSAIGTSVTGGISRTGVIQAGGKISFAATSGVFSPVATPAGETVSSCFASAVVSDDTLVVVSAALLSDAASMFADVKSTAFVLSFAFCVETSEVEFVTAVLSVFTGVASAVFSSTRNVFSLSV